MIKRKTYLKRSGPIKRRTPIKKGGRVNKVASKRSEQIAHYHAVERPQYLREHPTCEVCKVVKDFMENGEGDLHKAVVWWPVCSIKAVEIHHKAGRDGMLLLAMEYFMSSCSSKPHENGHTWIKEHPAQAAMLNLTISRLGGLYR